MVCSLTICDCSDFRLVQRILPINGNVTTMAVDKEIKVFCFYVFVYSVVQALKQSE